MPRDPEPHPPRTTPRERRREGRHLPAPPLGVSALAASVHDVSRSGICLLLATPEPLAEPGCRLDLTLTDQLDGCRQQFVAEVLWRVGDRAGCRWVNLTPEQDQWLLTRFHRWLLAGVLSGTP